MTTASVIRSRLSKFPLGPAAWATEGSSSPRWRQPAPSVPASRTMTAVRVDSEKDYHAQEPVRPRQCPSCCSRAACCSPSATACRATCLVGLLIRRAGSPHPDILIVCVIYKVFRWLGRRRANTPRGSFSNLQNNHIRFN